MEFKVKKLQQLKRDLILLTGLLVQLSAWAQDIIGTVRDAHTGEPIIGAVVSVKGKSANKLTSVTDIDGKFRLKVDNTPTVLLISYTGYNPEEVDVYELTNEGIDVNLSENLNHLQEVVVVGYGQQKKSDLTGALTQINSETLTERPVQNVLQALQGKAPGVQVSSNNRPGELGSVLIRGSRSLLADNAPLYVVDGIPFTAGSLSDIAPSDIESIEILKDASATAIYGSRGANGVILVNTKKGAKGKVTINYDGTFSWSTLHSLTDWMSAGEQLDYKRQAAITGGTYNGSYGTAPDPDRDKVLFIGTEEWCDRVIKSGYQYDANGNVVLRDATEAEKAAGYADQVPVYDSSKLLNTDWADLATRTAFSQNHQVSLSAGSDKSKLYISLGYLDQQVPMKDQDYTRVTANVNGSIQATQWLNVGLNLNAAYSLKNYGIVQNSSNAVAKDSYGLALNTLPWVPAYNEDGSYLIGSTSGSAGHNILSDIDESENEYRYYATNLSSYAELDFGHIYAPLQGLKWRTNFGAQFRSSRYGSYYGENWSNPYEIVHTAAGVAYNQHSESLSWTLENLIFYEKDITPDHHIGLTLLQSAERYRTESLNVRAYGTVYPTAKWYDVADSDDQQTTYGSGYTNWTRASYMARLNYAFKNRYLLTLTGRKDGASVLAEGNKWDFFPSAAFAWKASEESFLRDVKWLDQLKLRAGYGVTGNSSVSAYSTSGSVTSEFASIPFGIGGNVSNTTGAKPDVMPNYDLKWERTSSFNLGVDFSVFRGRLNGSIDFYTSRTSDVIMNRSIPVITGYAQIRSNVGETQNRGFELALSSTNIQTRNFTWQTDLSFSTNHEEIVSLVNGKEDMAANNWFIGEALNVYYDYKYDRIWQNTEEDALLRAAYSANGLTFLAGQYKIKDQPLILVDENTAGAKSFTYNGTTYYYENNGFGTFDEDDKVVYNKSPKWEAGLTNTFKYKNWTLSTYIYGRFGGWYYGLTQTIGRRVENDTWSETNTDAAFAQPTTATRTTDYDYVRNYSRSDMVLVKNIGLSYTFKRRQLRSLGLGSAEVYAQVLNPFIFGGELVKAGINPDDVTGWTSSNHIGGQTNNTAITKSFVLGVKLGF